MIPLSQRLKNAADAAGCKRVRFNEHDIPTTESNICIFLAFGDYRSNAILSALLLKRFREESKSSKYFILIGYPGMEGLFPCVNEYWCIKPDATKAIYLKSNLFANSSDIILGISRTLRGYFEDIIDYKSLESYYNLGFKKEFFNRFTNIKRYFPSIPSSSILGVDFSRRVSLLKDKVFIYPVMYAESWNQGKVVFNFIPKEFWVALTQYLYDKGLTPVINHNFLTYDLSGEFYDKALMLKDLDALSTMSAMRSTGFVLDLFSGISRLAVIARTPYLFIQERNFYNLIKEWELDDLMGKAPFYNLFSFSMVLDEINKDNWKSSLFDVIISKSSELIKYDINKLPDTVESESVISYDSVRNIQNKKFGIPLFIKSLKEG